MLPHAVYYSLMLSYYRSQKSLETSQRHASIYTTLTTNLAPLPTWQYCRESDSQQYRKSGRGRMGFHTVPTSSSLIATQLFEGNPWSMGTRNWRQPDQWPTKSIMQIRLNMRMNTLAMFRNWKKRKSLDPQFLSNFKHGCFQRRKDFPGSPGSGCNIKRANRSKQNLWNRLSFRKSMKDKTRL